MNDLGQLDDYSRFAVSLILERFPRWRDYLIVRRTDDCPHAFAEFEITAPSPAIEHGLWVSTADEEITVGLHTHHSHFTDYENRFTADHIQQALDHIQELLDERSGIVSWYVGDRFAGSTCRETQDVDPLSSCLSGITQATFRSWRGTYDCDAEPTFGRWFARLFRNR